MSRNTEWRRQNPDAWRAQKTRYYRQTGSGQIGGARPRTWTADEDRNVLARAVSDRQLAADLDRSVMAIQIRRCRLRGGLA